MTVLAQRALQPLDSLRSLCLRTVVRVPPLRRVLIDRESRVPFLLTAHASVAFALALLAPSLVLALAPIVLGVPHVASDVRYLVLRRQLPRWWLRAIWIFAVALISIRLLEESHVLPQAPLLFEHAIGSTWVLLGAIGGAVAGKWRRSALFVLAAAATIAAFSLIAPRPFRLTFVHVHNLLAIAIWALLFRRAVRWGWVPVAVVIVGAALLASGVLLRTTIQHGTLSAFGLHLFVAADWMAPGLPDTQAIGLTMAFAFLQSVHYAVWLMAIPQDERGTRGGSNFRQAWRQLSRDLSPCGVALVVALALLVSVGAAFGLVRTRNLFLSLATFHGWLELALLGFFVARGSAARRAPAGLAAGAPG